jgi:hypothetical protein
MYAINIYKAKATSWGWTETTNGHPQFWMGFDILGIADRNCVNTQPKPCEPGRGRWSITPSTDKASAWLARTVRGLGYDRDDLLHLDPDHEGAFNFEGVEFLVECKHEEFNGQTREKWSMYTPRTKLASEKLAALNDRFGSNLSKSKTQEVANKATDITALALTTVATDNIPF